MYYNRILKTWVFTAYDKILLYTFGWQMVLSIIWVIYYNLKKKIKEIQQINNNNNFIKWEFEDSLALLDSYSYSFWTTEIRCLHVYFLSMESEFIIFPQFVIDIKDFGFLTKNLSEFEIKQKKLDYQSIFVLLENVIKLTGGADVDPLNDIPKLSPAEQINKKPESSPVSALPVPATEKKNGISGYVSIFLRNLFITALKSLKENITDDVSNKVLAHLIVNCIANKFLEIINGLALLIAPPKSTFNSFVSCLLGLAFSIIPFCLNLSLLASFSTLPIVLQLFYILGGTAIAILQGFFGLLVIQQFGMESLQFLACLLPLLIRLLKRALEYIFKNPNLFIDFDLKLPKEKDLINFGIYLSDNVHQTTNSKLYENFFNRGEHKPLNDTLTNDNGFAMEQDDLDSEIPSFSSPIAEPEEIPEQYQYQYPSVTVNQEDIKRKIENYLNQNLDDNINNITKNKDKLVD